MFDAFTILVMLLPLGCYLLVIGWLCSSSRPVVVSGARDFFALGLGCTGLFLAGPFSLFFPQSAFNILGGWVWLAILLLYLLLVLLLTLGQRPRILAYSANSTEFVQQVAGVLSAMDASTQWAGASFHCPNLHIEGTVDARPGDRVAQIIASSKQQDLSQWVKFQHNLQRALLNSRVASNWLNIWLMLGSILLIAAFSLILTRTSETVSAMREILRF